MVNKKLKFVSRIIMCGLVMIMAAGVGESVKAAGGDSGIQPLSYKGYDFALATCGVDQVDFDITEMRPKNRESNSYVEGVSGSDEAILIWAVGHTDAGFHLLANSTDCSGGYTYRLYKDSRITMCNEAYQMGLGYTAIAGQITVEEFTYIHGLFKPDAGN